MTETEAAIAATAEMTAHPTGDVPTVSVLLVDDHGVCREGVRAMLADSEFHIAHEAQASGDALEAMRRFRPQLVLLEIRTASGTGLDILRTLRTEFPGVPVVILTMHRHPVYVARAVAEGAVGYILKGIGRAELLVALRAVAQGETLFGPQELVEWLRKISRSATMAFDVIRPLSERELDVLGLLGAGLSNRDIARILFIAQNTVKTHIEHIVRKLGVSDRTQAAVWAARMSAVSTQGAETTGGELP